MKNQAYRMTMLYDFYGETLTQRQKEFFDLYYNEDLSLAEIAENYGISRQGVRDVIVRAEGIMTALEDQTGIIKRFHHLQTQLSTIAQQLEQIDRLNQTKYRDDALEEILLRAQTLVEQMKQE